MGRPKKRKKLIALAEDLLYEMHEKMKEMSNDDYLKRDKWLDKALSFMNTKTKLAETEEAGSLFKGGSEGDGERN